ncbi:hypothetical protein [Streptosporangium sp. CA-115845]|uniref:hypothetical protein n=1 Tax=Streptosporangium sp. CA-115845 TaxID=3240071 RepID=UPI003D90F593
MKPFRVGVLVAVALLVYAAYSCGWVPASATNPALPAPDRPATAVDACGDARVAVQPALHLAQAAIEETSAGDARVASITAARDLLTEPDVIAEVNACLTADRSKGLAFTRVSDALDQAVHRISAIQETGRADETDRAALADALRTINAALTWKGKTR